MRNILTILLLFIAFNSYSQNANILPKGLPSPKTNGYEEKGWYRGDSGYLIGPRADTMFSPIAGLGAKILWQNKYWNWNLSLLKWELESVVTDTTSLSNRINQKLNASDTVSLSNRINKVQQNLVDTSAALRTAIANAKELIPAGPITSLATVGFNPGTNLSSGQWITNTFYQTQPPGAGLTGGATVQRSNTADTRNLTASIIRNSATALISSAVITAPSQNIPLTFAQPSQPGTTNVVQSVTTPANVNTTYTLTVSTNETPAKTAMATQNLNWASNRYWGFINDTTNIRAGTGGIDAILSALSRELNDSRSKTWNSGTPTGNQFFVYLYWGASGALTQFDFNGVPTLDGTSNVLRNFTAENGFVGQFRIYWTKNLQSTSSQLIAN